ncbi:AraC family transcriptional regulator, partial [bacterium]
MKVEIFDIVNIIIMFQLVIFSIFLFLKKRSLPNILLGVQLFSQAAGIFAGYCFTQFEFFYSNFPFLFFAGYPFVFLWGPTFYLYVKSAAYIDFKLKPDHLIHFVPFLL